MWRQRDGSERTAHRLQLRSVLLHRARVERARVSIREYSSSTTTSLACIASWSRRAQRGVIDPMTHVDREHRSVRIRCAVRHEQGCPFRTSASRLSRQCWSRPRRSLWRSGAASLRAWSTSQATTRELSVTPVAVRCEAYSLAIRQPARRRP